MFGHPWFGCCEFTEENGKTPAPMESHFSISKKWENSSSQVSQWKNFSGQRMQTKAKQRERQKMRKSISCLCSVNLRYYRKCTLAVLGTLQFGWELHSSKDRNRKGESILYNSKYVSDKLTCLKWLWLFLQIIHLHASLCYHGELCIIMIIMINLLIQG